MNAPVVTFEVAKRFRLLRRRYIAVRLGTTGAIAVAWLMFGWIALAAVDYVYEWKLLARQLALGAMLVATCGWWGWRQWSIVRANRRRQFVGRLERSYQEFGQRIRTVLDTVDGRIGGPTEMLAALGHQTLGRWETLTPSRLVPWRALAAWAALAVGGLSVAGGLFAVGGDWRTAMLRVVGASGPYTTLAVSPGDVRLLEGAPVAVSLELSGRTGRDVMLRYRELGQPVADSDAPGDVMPGWTESELLPSVPRDPSLSDSRRAVFVASLGAADQAIEYQFLTSIGSTRVFRIDVQPLIDAQRVEAVVKPPDYTRLEQRSFASADVTVLQHSKVTVTILTNHPLGEATLQIGSKPSDLQQVAVDRPDDPTRWSFQLPTQEPLYWRFSGEGTDGTPMTPADGRLRIRYDRPPSLSWRDPLDEMRVHTLAELPMRVQVSDDYGIRETGIAFQLGDEEYVLTDWSIDEGDSDPAATTRVQLEKVLPLESFGLTERDYVAYYAYAVDNRGSGFQRSESDIRYIDIRPLRQFFSESESDPMDGAGRGVLVQLGEIIRRQRFLINQTRQLTRSSRVDLAAQLGRIDRMVESQSELAGLTRFLAEFFISRGNDDVEALSQAEAAMLQAADSLAAGSFDLALVQEQDALRALAEARRSLEIILPRRLTPREQQALRRLAQQLRQKLRRDPPETEQDIADTLQRLAADQVRLGQTAATLWRQQNAETETEAEKEADGGGSSDQPASSGPSIEDPSQTADDPPSPQQQRDELFASQIDLLERLLAIEEQLTDRLDSSSLMAQRMQDAKAAIDRLAEQVRDGSLDAFASATGDAAEQLREMALQLDALAAAEPVSRILAIRDMTTSLANAESQLANILRRESASPRQVPHTTLDPAALPPLVTRMVRRTETIQDVLKAPADVGDVEMSEVNENLERFLEEEGFLQQLSATRQAANRSADDSGGDDSAADQARRRAIDYAQAAQRLDELYRQLVTPRLARLRQMEQQAHALVKKISGGEMGEQSAEAKAGTGSLQSDLKAAGLEELAEMLRSEYWSEETPPPSSASGLRSDGGFSLRTSLSGRVLLVAKELQDRIQEAILLEVSADRDAPVPAQYRTAVDRYFRVIAGGAEASDTAEAPTP